MFCDLVGSTAMSARLDPEDMREVIAAYQKCVSETVRRFGGFIAKYMGDGVLGYFGYPQANEHDAERAVRAGSPIGRRLAPTLENRLPSAARMCAGPRDRDLLIVGDLFGLGRGAGA